MRIPAHSGKLTTVIVAMTASVAIAGVEFSISPGPYYIGAPFDLTIKVINESEHEPPTLPEIEGADVGEIFRSTQQTIINFKASRTVVYQFPITPRRAGPLVIPSIQIAIAGESMQTSPKTLTVSKSDSGDLLFVEVHPSRESIYLGESLELTLEIWIKQYLDRRNNFGTATDMQSCIDFRNSSWGLFGELLEDLRRLPVRHGQRTDAGGVEHQYYVYQLRRTVWPEKTDLLDLGNISIIVRYPLRVDRDRTFFFSEARVTRARPVIAAPEMDPVVVKPIPTPGQPPWFNGAVGRYQFAVTAKPTEVRIGDPITLTMSLRGGGQLDLLQPPRLEKVAPLVEQFKIPDEMLAGEVKGNTKRFTQTIRARNDAVEEIPQIPFTYFDTASEAFVTLHSDPIPIHVAVSDRMAVSTMVESDTGSRVSTRLTHRGEGILANYSDIDALLSEEGFATVPQTVAWIASPPVLFLFITLVRRRHTRLKFDVAYASRRTAKTTALRALQRAATAGERPDNLREEAACVLAAVTQFVADRCGSPEMSLTRAEAVQRLRQGGVSQERVRSIDALLDECESLQYAGSGSQRADALSARARHCINELQKERF